MSIVYYAILLVFLVLVIEVISLIFKATGLEIGKARFQVISILTHTGFTTRESELISQHGTRRKIASYLMLISYVAQAGLISLFTKILIDKDGVSDLLLVIISIALLFVIVGRNRTILSRFDKFIERYIVRRIRKTKKQKTIEEVLKINPDYGVYEVVLEEKNAVCGKTLREARLKDRFIQILNIDRGSHIIEFPDAGLVLNPADKLVVYGKVESIIRFMSEQK